MRRRSVPMNKKESVFRRQLNRIFKTPQDQKLIDAINIRNIRNIHTFSAVACVFDAANLALFSAMNWKRPDFWQTFINVFCCIAACVLIVILSKMMMQRYEKDGVISNRRANIVVTLFYIALSAWGILVDTAHYADGEQMLTFYIVQFCFVCFVVMEPRIGIVLISLSYCSLYICLYLIDGAEKVQPQNYIMFAAIAVVGNAIQYMMLQESEKYKADILQLNHILQQEASVDDLTKLKNRTALRNDFEQHIGKNVYTIMADVDQFKRYNDIYGHLVGDEVLRMVALATGKTFYDGDVYRYGGDEFLIIIPEYTEQEFEEKTALWKEAVQSINIPDITESITISYGYQHSLLKDTDDLRRAIKIADERLYKSKRMQYGAEDREDSWRHWA